MITDSKAMRVSFQYKLAKVLRIFRLEWVQVDAEDRAYWNIEQQREYLRWQGVWRVSPYDENDEDLETVEMVAETPKRLIEIMYESYFG